MDGFPSIVPSRRRSLWHAGLLFGIALSILSFGIGCGDFTLFGDEDDNGAQGPCDGDPCGDIDNAQAASCEADGDSDFTCDCDDGYFWKDDGDTCEDPCDPDPCDEAQNELAGTCSAQGAEDFTCSCLDGFEWNGSSNACEELPFQLSSSAFSDGGQIPLQYAHADCDGDNVSPSLAWENIPGDTQSFALFLVDSDSDPDFVHWAVSNIPASLAGIGEGMVPQGATQLQNDFGDEGYGGPCPPQNEEHEYTFTIMALSVEQIDATSYEDALEDAGDAAIATASLVGRYSNIPDPCEGDPCDGLDHAVDQTCEAEGSDDFSCQCDSGYEWSHQNDRCEEMSEGLLGSLQSGPYSFTVQQVNDGIFPFGLLGTFLYQGKILDETVEIPSLDQVPVKQTTISMDLDDGAFVDLVIDIDQVNETDDFYTLSGEATGEVTVSLPPPVGSVSCELTNSVCDGVLTPESTTTVTVSLTISDPEVTEPCSSFATLDGTIELTLSGELQ